MKEPRQRKKPSRNKHSTQENQTQTNKGKTSAVGSYWVMTRSPFRIGYKDKLAGECLKERFRDHHDADLYESGRLFAAFILERGYGPTTLPRPGVPTWQACAAFIYFNEALSEGVWP